jgi:hypothetical protein
MSTGRRDTITQFPEGGARPMAPAKKTQGVVMPVVLSPTITVVTFQ